MPSRFKSPIKADKADRRVRIREGELSDSRLDLLVDCGMPDLDDRISIQWAGQYFDPKFKGYSIELFGVEAEEAKLEREIKDDPDSVYLLSDKYATTPHHVILIITDAKPGHFTVKKYIIFYVWLCRVRGPGQQIISEEVWQRKNGWVQLARGTGVSLALYDDARALLQFIEKETKNKKAKLKSKTERKPRISRIPRETFLSEGLAGAESLAIKGKAHLKIYELAAEMGRDRETVSNAAKLYKEEWAVINKRFTDTREWLKRYKKR